MMDKSIGEKIRERRKELKMTQQALADKSKISRGTVNSIECGMLHDVRVGTLSAIAEALGTTVDSFF